MGVVKGSTVKISPDLARRQEKTISSNTRTNETLPTLEPTMTARLEDDVAVCSPDAGDAAAAAGWVDGIGIDIVTDEAVDESPGSPDDDDEDDDVNDSGVAADEGLSAKVLMIITPGVCILELEGCPATTPAGGGGLIPDRSGGRLWVASSTVL